jgi:phosphate acetyltransferase
MSYSPLTQDNKLQKDMEILQQMLQRAQANPQRIVLPEGDEPRTLEAANILLKDKVAKLILIGDPAVIRQMAEEKGYEYILSNDSELTILDPLTDPKMPEYANLLFELRKAKGMTLEQATEKVKDPLYLGCLMIKNGDADGELAGARGTTADTIRPAFQILKTRPGVHIVSGAFLMFTPATHLGEGGFLVFADCAVNPCPNAQELAEIAVTTAETARALGGIEPRVAMLSFSSKGSAKHELVDKVVEATRLAHEMAPDLALDGELQLDAALVESVGAQKAPGSAVAGKANVLVFPDLQAGNIGYKLVERFSGADAVGPILQGIAAPVNDLSRGCKVQDIVQMVIITANQAIGMK